MSELELELEKTPTAFNKFLSLGKFFKKSSDIKAKKRILEKNADFFLKTENYESYLGMLVEGYEPTNKQNKIFYKFINRLISWRTFTNVPDENNTNKKINLFVLLDNALGLNKKIQLDEKLVIDTLSFSNDSLLSKNIELFTNPSHIIKFENHYFPNLSNQYKNLYYSENFGKKLFNKFSSLKNFYVPGSLYSFSNVISFLLKTNPKHLLHDISLEQFIKVTENLTKEKVHTGSLEIYKKTINTFYSKDVNNILKDTKQIYENKTIDTITINKIKQEEHTFNELPVIALDIIEHIENTYYKIKANSPSYLHDDLLTLERLFEMRIPEILTKYLTIDDIYKKTLLNVENKNAEQLMLESLNNVKESFDDVFKKINEDSLSSLSATNRYIKALKN